MRITASSGNLKSFRAEPLKMVTCKKRRVKLNRLTKLLKIKDIALSFFLTAANEFLSCSVRKMIYIFDINIMFVNILNTI